MMIFLQFYGTLTDILQQWESMRIFYYALPFLLIFALVFAILSKTKVIGEEKGINTVISLAVGLLALQFDYVPQFFSVIMPRIGIGLSILLAAIILMGLAMPMHIRRNLTILMWIGGTIALVVILSTFSSYQWWHSTFWQNNMPMIITGIILIIFVSIVISGGKTTREEKESAWEIVPKE